MHFNTLLALTALASHSAHAAAITKPATPLHDIYLFSRTHCLGLGSICPSIKSHECCSPPDRTWASAAYADAGSARLASNANITLYSNRPGRTRSLRWNGCEFSVKRDELCATGDGDYQGGTGAEVAPRVGGAVMHAKGANATCRDAAEYFFVEGGDMWVVETGSADGKAFLKIPKRDVKKQEKFVVKHGKKTKAPSRPPSAASTATTSHGTKLTSHASEATSDTSEATRSESRSTSLPGPATLHSPEASSTHNEVTSKPTSHASKATSKPAKASSKPTKPIKTPKSSKASKPTKKPHKPSKATKARKPSKTPRKSA